MAENTFSMSDDESSYATQPECDGSPNQIVYGFSLPDIKKQKDLSTPPDACPVGASPQQATEVLRRCYDKVRRDRISFKKYRMVRGALNAAEKALLYDSEYAVRPAWRNYSVVCEELREARLQNWDDGEKKELSAIQDVYSKRALELQEVMRFQLKNGDWAE
jgi:hypothetical protein